ncbi:hypothetical protein [Pseudoduganella namucuonensis]|uniref:hypothetical protein n=1 Tax=Pseudoduganella namucuonensis TaxID=1035707 RepID=UPI001160AE01|nr:hypothetical protein [Pseudoduganella namucuonensis]
MLKTRSRVSARLSIQGIDFLLERIEQLAVTAAIFRFVGRNDSGLIFVDVGQVAHFMHSDAAPHSGHFFIFTAP